MGRAPFQVLVLPYQYQNNSVSFCIFQRSDGNYWQGIAGGGENNETAIEAALREAKEEADLDSTEIIQLQTMSYVSVKYFRDNHLWDSSLYVIPEYCFGLKVRNGEIKISKEHISYKWCSYEMAFSLLKYDGNKTALWELNQRVFGKSPKN